VEGVPRRDINVVLVCRLDRCGDDPLNANIFNGGFLLTAESLNAMVGPIHVAIMPFSILLK
jgi:hypothetical protein